MGRFIFWTAIFLVVGGGILFFKVHIPWVSYWLGNFPGDFIVQKGELSIPVPIVSAVLASAIFSTILWIFFGSKGKS